MRISLAAGLALAVVAVPASAQDGATLYKRCAVCHLNNGAGIPGAFPPLRIDVARLAAKADGRRYLVLVVARGLAGPIMVDGKTYRGIMPAQSGLDDAQIAATLNHVVVAVVGAKGVKTFTAAEVARYKSGGAALTPTQVGALGRQALGR